MSHLSENDLNRIFEKMDRDQDGVVSLEEISSLLESIGFHYAQEELESTIGKASLAFEEFSRFYYGIWKSGQDDPEVDTENPEVHGGEGVTKDLLEAFRVFDIDGDGFITSDEIEKVLKRLGLWGEVEEIGDSTTMIRVYDINLDGVLDFEEFKDMMLRE